MTFLLYGAAHVKALPVIPRRTFIRDFEGLVLHVDSVDSRTNEMTGVFIRDEREAGAPTVIVAHQGKLERTAAAKESPGKIYLHLREGNLLKTSINSNLPTERLDFHAYSLLVRTEPDAFVLPDHPRFNSGRELLDKIAASLPASQNYRDYSTEFWKRIFFSLSPLALLLAGCGLGAIPMRSGNAAGGMIAVAVAAGYWFFLVISMSLAGSGSIPAFWAMQAPNWVSLLFGFLIYRKSGSYVK